MADGFHGSFLDAYRLEYCDRVSFEGREYRPLGLLSDGVLLQEVVGGADGETLHVETTYLAEHLAMGLATYEPEFYKYGKVRK